jgi:transcription initiation factor IIE alpha subunit
MDTRSFLPTDTYGDIFLQREIWDLLCQLRAWVTHDRIADLLGKDPNVVRRNLYALNRSRYVSRSICFSRPPLYSLVLPELSSVALPTRQVL